MGMSPLYAAGVTRFVVVESALVASHLGDAGAIESVPESTPRARPLGPDPSAHEESRSDPLTPLTAPRESSVTNHLRPHIRISPVMNRP
jgi:hypothetical protein